MTNWNQYESLASRLDAADVVDVEPRVSGSASDENDVAGQLVDDDTAAEKSARKSQADALVTFAAARFNFLHDRNGDPYAQAKSSGEVRRLGSSQFKNRLIADFYKGNEVAVRDQAWREALGTLQAIARHTGDPQDVFIRCGARDGAYYLDLAQPDCSTAIELSPEGWYISDNPPVMFVRGESMQPLPHPQRGGDISPLWRIANIPEGQRLLVLTWLIDCLRTDTPNPGLELLGEQGSGKSTTAEALRRVLDPNACNLRGAPKTTQDIFVGAAHNFVVAYENVSYLAGPMQDALAILSTGGGYATRALYTDSEEHVISVRRPWVVNGISACVTQQDLVDRVISVECPQITGREPSARQWETFNHDLPGILGGLLDLAVKALAELSNMTLPREERPRLLEYVLLGMAVAKAMGQPTSMFLEAFRATRKETVARTIDASPVAGAVLSLIEDEPQGITASVKDILARLERYKPPGAGDTWPRSPKGLGDALRRAAPALRQLDVDVRSLGNVGGKVRWSIGKKSVTPSHGSHEVMPDHDIKTCMTSGGEVSADDAEQF